MRRMLLVLLLLVLPAVPAYAQAGNSARVTQVDSSRYPDVTLYVSVTDPAGRFLPLVFEAKRPTT